MGFMWPSQKACVVSKKKQKKKRKKKSASLRGFSNVIKGVCVHRSSTDLAADPGKSSNHERNPHQLKGTPATAITLPATKSGV
jgi:hypothetical protein